MSYACALWFSNLKKIRLTFSNFPKGHIGICLRPVKKTEFKSHKQFIEGATEAWQECRDYRVGLSTGSETVFQCRSLNLVCFLP